MSLPFFKDINKHNYEPIYRNLFEIRYSSNDLTVEESNYLTSESYKIEKNIISINTNSIDNSISVFEILQKLNIFSLKVLIHNKTDDVLGMFIYENCKIINLLESLVDFDFSEPNDIIQLHLELEYSKLEYVDSKNMDKYLRMKKLERLTK